MILTIVILGIVAGLGVQLIAPIFSSYSDTKIKDILFQDAKFAVERIARELRNSVPNSIRLTSSNGIQFTLFSLSSYYSDNTSSDSKIKTDNVTFDNLSINDNLSIYNTNPSHLYGKSRVYEIIGDNVSSKEIFLNKDIEEHSPYKRFYRIKFPVTYYLDSITHRLIRTFNYPLSLSEYGLGNGVNPDFINTMAVNVSKLEFEYQPGTLQRNAIVNIYLELEKYNIKVNYSQSIHIRNLP
jgi:MSHA biogenesis protein MshO